MIGALPCRYLGTTPACLLGTLLEVALRGKGRNRHGQAGLVWFWRQIYRNFVHVSLSLPQQFVSVALRPSAPYCTVPDAQLYYVHTVCIHPVPCRLLAFVAYGKSTCSGLSRLEAQIDALIDVPF